MQAEWQQQLMQGSHGASSSGQEDARRRVRVNRDCRGAQKQTSLRCFVLRPSILLHPSCPPPPSCTARRRLAACSPHCTMLTLVRPAAGSLTRLNSANAFLRKSLIADQELLVLAREDVVGDGS